MVMNEVPYIVEWIEFMALQGVSRFIIYNDDSSDQIDLLNQFYKEKLPERNVIVIPRKG